MIIKTEDLEKIKKAIETLWGKQYHVQTDKELIYVQHKIMNYVIVISKANTPYKIPTYRLGMDPAKYRVRLTTKDLKNIKATLYALDWITEEQATKELKEIYENIY